MPRQWIVTFILSTLLAFPAAADALTLARGTETHLTGTLGDVQVNYVVDEPMLAGYLSTGGIVELPAGKEIPVRRIQYDLHNQIDNGTVFAFRVDSPSGAPVIAAADAQGFWESGGTLQTYWGGVAYATLFDAGYGTYTYNAGGYGGEWDIVYAPDHVSWLQLGNGFFRDTATGSTEFGFYPTFALFFDRSIPLGLQPASVDGYLASGLAVSANGMTLSAVPEPGSLVLLATGLTGALGIIRRGNR